MSSQSVKQLLSHLHLDLSGGATLSEQLQIQTKAGSTQVHLFIQYRCVKHTQLRKWIPLTCKTQFANSIMA